MFKECKKGERDATGESETYLVLLSSVKRKMGAKL